MPEIQKQQRLVYFAKKKKIKETQIGKLHESMKEKEKKEILGRWKRETSEAGK